MMSAPFFMRKFWQWIIRRQVKRQNQAARVTNEEIRYLMGTWVPRDPAKAYAGPERRKQ